jgi:hypothetical protein
MTIITSFIFIELAMALQKAYSFIYGNSIVHSFLDLAIVYKCEEDFYISSSNK